MKLVQVDSKEIQGLRLRTSNTQEMDGDTAKIPAFVEFVDKNLTIDYRSGSHAYSVYFNYDLDANGEFDVLMGSDEVESSELPLEHVITEPGQYLKFTGTGEFPAAIIETWQKIWNYFSNPDCPYRRKFTTDFECYESPTEVSIYIAVEF